MNNVARISGPDSAAGRESTLNERVQRACERIEVHNSNMVSLLARAGLNPPADSAPPIAGGSTVAVPTNEFAQNVIRLEQAACDLERLLSIAQGIA